MNLIQIAQILESLSSKINTEFVQYGLTGIFLLYATDRVVGLFSMRATRHKIANWSDSQGHFLGATNDIKRTAKTMGMFALALVIAKPLLMIAALYFQQPFIDPIGVLILGGIVLFYYYIGVSKFLRREQDGNATRVPMQMKQAWLQLDLHRTGLSLFQVRYAVLIILAHTLYQTYQLAFLKT